MADKKGAAAGLVTATYPVTSGNRVKLYALGSDAADGKSGAFADLALAIKAAQSFIFIADWSFQPFTRIEPRVGTASLNDTVGHLLNDAANRGVLVAIHVWDHTSILGAGAPDSQNDAANGFLDSIVSATSGGKQKKRSPNLLWRMTSRSGTGNSIHQKFVVLDADEGLGKRVVKVFMGGLDLTKGRFDFGDHPIAAPATPGQPFAASVSVPGTVTDDWYNAEFTRSDKGRSGEPGDPAMPRQPWQDFYLQMIGPSSWDILREFVGRWNTDGTSTGLFGPQGDTSNAQRQQVRDKFLDVFTSGKFLQEDDTYGPPTIQPYPQDGGPFQARIIRSLEKGEWDECILNGGVFKKNTVLTTDTKNKAGTKREFTWRVGGNFESSIQNSYLRSIATANRFIYIETQYFIGSGARWTNGVDAKGLPAADPETGVGNRVPEAIVEKIIDRIKHDLDFHAYVVIPMFPEGDPSGQAAARQRFFEFQTMKFMALAVAREAEKKKRDWRDFLSFYCLANWTPQPTVTVNGDRRTRVLKNQRYQIYVHSKLMIIDDEFLLVGSANLNERSLAGDRDTEIGVWISADEDSSTPSRQIIHDLRQTTWSQHLGGILPPDFDNPEKPTCAQRMQNIGETNWVAMASGLRTDKSHLLHFPFQVDTTANSMFVRVISPKSPLPLADQDRFIFDAPAKAAGPNVNGSVIDAMWAWHSPSSFSALNGVAE